MFSRFNYVSLMPDDDKLTPATRQDVEICLSLGLTSGRSLARNQAAEVTAKVVAERLVGRQPDYHVAESSRRDRVGSAADRRHPKRAKVGIRGQEPVIAPRFSRLLSGRQVPRCFKRPALIEPALT